MVLNGWNYLFLLEIHLFSGSRIFSKEVWPISGGPNQDRSPEQVIRVYTYKSIYTVVSIFLWNEVGRSSVAWGERKYSMHVYILALPEQVYLGASLYPRNSPSTMEINR